MLEENTSEFLSHERGVTLNEGSLVLSSMFDWYRDDFGSNFDELKLFLKPSLPQTLAPILIDAKRAEYQYDWNLNRP